MGYYIASVFAFLGSFSPRHHIVDPMLCPSPRHYIVDPMLFPSGNPVKNAMKRFRSLQPFYPEYHVCSGSVFTAYLCNSSLLLPFLMVYYIVPVLLLLAFWCPCMTINVSIQYNGGLLPDIILLTQCYPIGVPV